MGRTEEVGQRHEVHEWVRVALEAQSPSWLRKKWPKDSIPRVFVCLLKMSHASFLRAERPVKTTI